MRLYEQTHACKDRSQIESPNYESIEVSEPFWASATPSPFNYSYGAIKQGSPAEEVCQRLR